MEAYTVEQVAEMLHVGRDKVYYLLRTGQLRSIKIGKLRRITNQHLAEFIASLETAKPERDALTAHVEQRATLFYMRDTTLPPVRVAADFKERLARYAATQDRDVSWVIRKAIEEYLDRHEEKG